MNRKTEGKAILRAWLYRILADIEQCDSVDAHKETLNGERVKLDITFNFGDNVITDGMKRKEC
jgi:hypothetical protein